MDVEKERERSSDFASERVLSKVLTFMNDRLVLFVESTNHLVKLLSMSDNPS